MNSTTAMKWNIKLMFSEVAAPTDVAVETETADSLMISWVDPNSNTEHFKVKCTCESDNCDGYENENVLESPHTCNNLTPGSTYSIAVTAVIDADEKTSDTETGVTSKKMCLLYW